MDTSVKGIMELARFAAVQVTSTTMPSMHGFLRQRVRFWTSLHADQNDIHQPCAMGGTRRRVPGVLPGNNRMERI